MSIIHATHAEFTKQFSTAIWWILALVLFLYVSSMAGGFAALLGWNADGILAGDEGVTIEVIHMIYSFSSSLGYVFALIIGTLMVTSEFRHQTFTPTFLAVPNRGTAMFAKVLTGIYVGALFGVIALFAAVGPGAGLLALFGQPTGLDDVHTWAMFARVILALMLWTLLGIGIGALVRNQVAAVVGIIAATQFIEPIVRVAALFLEGADKVAAFFPGAASDALVGSSFYSITATPTSFELEWWQGGLVLGGITVVFLLLGYLFSWRRDVS